MGSMSQQRILDMGLSSIVNGPPAPPQLTLIGTSYKSSGLGFRETLARNVREDHLDDALVTADESALLSTCNRFELYFVSRTPKETSAALLQHLQGLTGLNLIEPSFYQLRGPQAVEHLFRVASGLESVVVGEPQILSQVRAAGVRSRSRGDARAILSPLFDRAYRAGSRVREAYGLQSDEMSLSDLAIDAVNRLHPGRKVVMLIGTGKMIRLAARRLKGRAKRLYVVSKRKTPPPGLGWCTLIKYSEVKRVAEKCDVLISATAAERPLITPDVVEGRRKRVVVDLGMPRNVSESVRSLRNVRLMDLDDLARLASRQRMSRDLKDAETAVSKEAQEFYGWLLQTRLSTTLADLYAWAEAVREEELKRATSKLKPISERELRVIDAMGRRIVSKLLARPTRFARKKHMVLSEEKKLELLRSVFGAGAVDGG